MRLIDADALIKVIQQNDYMLTAKHNSMAPGMFTSGIRQAVDESQTIDPVKHGKWIERTFDEIVSEMDCGEIVYENHGSKLSIKCSVCGEGKTVAAQEEVGQLSELRRFVNESIRKAAMSNYCPSCGARMDGEE